MNTLQWIEDNKFYLVHTNNGLRWRSTLNRGDYSKPAPVYTHEELLQLYGNYQYKEHTDLLDDQGAGENIIRKILL